MPYMWATFFFLKAASTWSAGLPWRWVSGSRPKTSSPARSDIPPRPISPLWPSIKTAGPVKWRRLSWRRKTRPGETVRRGPAEMRALQRRNVRQAASSMPEAVRKAGEIFRDSVSAFLHFFVARKHRLYMLQRRRAERSQIDMHEEEGKKEIEGDHVHDI